MTPLQEDHVLSIRRLEPGEELPSIHGAGAARNAGESGHVVLIDADGEFLYPDNPEDEEFMIKVHGAVRVVGLICRALTCVCPPGTGHRSHPDTRW